MRRSFTSLCHLLPRFFHNGHQVHAVCGSLTICSHVLLAKALQILQKQDCKCCLFGIQNSIPCCASKSSVFYCDCPVTMTISFFLQSCIHDHSSQPCCSVPAFPYACCTNHLQMQILDNLFCQGHNRTNIPSGSIVRPCLNNLQ